MLKNFHFPAQVNLLFLSIFIFAIAMGIDLVCFPSVLSINGISSFKIGFAASFEVFGGIIASFFLSRLVAKTGIIKSLKIFSFGYAICISLIYFYQSFLLWLIFIFAMGFFWFLYVITRQSWLNMILTDEQRGVATGIFSMSIAAGLAVGPIIVKFSGATNYSSFLISAAMVLISYFCVSGIKDKTEINLSSAKIPVMQFFKDNPRSFMTRFFLDLQTYILLVCTVIFGVKIGLSYEAAGLLITAFMLSGVFDVVVGFLLKKTSPYKMINIGFLGCIYAFIVIILGYQYYNLLVIFYFIFGLSVACIFVSVFKIANEDYPKEQLVAANSTFQFIGSVGSICGALIGGLFLSIFGAKGFPIAIILSNVLFLTFLVFYEKKYSEK